ncbi:MAG TPA: hypothetical protein VLF09_02985 [Cellvibrio sp.]|nr:hypothetical protein [Cellvibrio sp.]
MHRQNFEDWAKDHPAKVNLEVNHHLNGSQYKDDLTSLLFDTWIGSALIPIEILRRLLNAQIEILKNPDQPRTELINSIHEAQAFMRKHDSEVQIIDPDDPQYFQGISSQN